MMLQIMLITNHYKQPKYTYIKKSSEGLGRHEGNHWRKEHGKNRANANLANLNRHSESANLCQGSPVFTSWIFTVLTRVDARATIQ